MKVIFSDHAKEQNKKRNILVSHILETVNRPEETKTSYRGRTIYRKIFGDRVLEVIAVVENDIIIIVTQYYLDK